MSECASPVASVSKTTIKLSRTFNYELVRRIVTHPKVYPFLSDDGSPPASEWEPSQNGGVYYVLVEDDGEPVGVLMFTPHNSICYEGHTALLPVVWGKGAEIGAMTALWMFENTPCRRIIGNAPIFNLRALSYAQRAGMHVFGVNERSYLKGGVLYDQIVLGMSKEDICR